MKRTYKYRFEHLEPRTLLAGHGDFNGDGFDDLAVGAPLENISGIDGAGAVSIIYGSRRGLSAAGNQFWHENVSGVDGAAANDDRFGSALAAGDFNGDGFDDLAISVPFKDVNGQSQAGAVNVLYGSQDGLRAGSVDQFWTQDSAGIGDVAEAGDRFGSALEVGDFNGDGRDDLAIGAPSEDIGALNGAGAVNVLYGSSSGLTNANDQFWHQNSSGINDAAEGGDQFGLSLATGDFDNDGRDDLAIGTQETLETIGNAGAVNVIYGSSGGLTNSGDQFWSQNSAGVADDAEAGDHFGGALAAGDFNDDGRDDLAIGAPLEIVGAVGQAGRVSLLYGSSAKLQSSGGVKQVTADALGFPTTFNSRFGSALAAGDFDGDGRDDLAIGASQETEGTLGAGAVYFVYGSSSLGLATTGGERWHEGDFGATAEFDDEFGTALVTGDYDGDGRADLAAGAPLDNEAGASDAGLVCVRYAFGFTIHRIPAWHQNLLNTSDGAELPDRFGTALG